MSSSITVVNNIEDIAVTVTNDSDSSTTAVESEVINIVVTDDTVIPTIVIETAQQGPQGPIGPKPVLDVTSNNGTLTVTVDDEVTTTLDVAGFITSTLNVGTGIPGSDVQYRNVDNTIIIPRGDTGASAYEVAVLEGFIGTVDDWLDSLIATARDAADEFANAPRGVEVEPGKYSGRHYMEESSDIYDDIVLLEVSTIAAESDANKIVNTAEDIVYTLNDGVTTGYSAKHYVAKTVANKVSTDNAVSDTIKIASTEKGTKYILSDGVTEGYSAAHYAERALEYRELAATSASDAFTSMETAALSATSASTSANTAITKAEEAVSSALSASNSETSALSYRNTTETYKNTAVSSASTAVNSATLAGNSESNIILLASQVNDDATQVALDKSIVASDKVQTGNDKIATNADVLVTNANKVSTNADALATAADRVQTNLDKIQTNADRSAVASDKEQTGLDKIQTGLDRIQTGNDVLATESNAAEALASEIAAANSAFDAATTLSQVELIMDNFSDRYLGAKTFDPSLDNDGNTLLVGAIYYNSLANEVRFYSGSLWERPEYSASQSAIASESSRVASVSAKTSSESARDIAIINAANASASETAAALSELNAEASATLADDRASFIDELVLGAKVSDPLTNNTGGALQTGSVYYNTINFAFKVYTGTEWRTAVFDASNAVSTFNGRTGTVELTEADVNNAIGINIIDTLATKVDKEILKREYTASDAFMTNVLKYVYDNGIRSRVGPGWDFQIAIGNFIKIINYPASIYNNELLEVYWYSGEDYYRVKRLDGSSVTFAELYSCQVEFYSMVNSELVLFNSASKTDLATKVNISNGRTQLSINNVDNTSDADKPISNATLEVLNAHSSLIGGNTASILQLARSNTHGAFGNSLLNIVIDNTPKVLEFDINMQSTNTDRFVLNANNTITAKTSGTYVFNSTMNIKDTGANGASRTLLFKITDGTTIWYTEIVNVAISKGDTSVIEINSIIVLPLNAVVPATAYITAECVAGNSGYSIIGFQSILSTEKTVAELQNLASATTVLPNASLSSTNVQSALEELQSDINGLDDYLGGLLTEELI